MIGSLMKCGTYMWTASAAGWFVLAQLTQSGAAMMACGGCIAAALIWHWVFEDRT